MVSTLLSTLRRRMMGAAPAPQVERFLIFEAEGESTLKIQRSGTSYSLNFWYSFDKVNWTKFMINSTTVSFRAGEPLYVRGSNPNGISLNSSRYVQFILTGDRGSISCSGNVMWLFDYEQDLTALPQSTMYSCYRLFYNQSALKTAPDFPATTLTAACYVQAFYGCSGLIKGPELPATTLTNNCYQQMFYSCSRMTQGPSTLPAKNGTQRCYSEMFYGCFVMTSAPSIDMEVAGSYSMYNMFQYCRFTTAPEIKLTTLAGNCCQGMFSYNTYLTTAPARLPATTLQDSCYLQMFMGCTALEVAPILPALSLVGSCYNSMFNGCSALNYIKALFTSAPNTNSGTYTWLANVAAQGTFVMNANATWNPEDYRNNSGVPVGWTVQTATS